MENSALTPTPSFEGEAQKKPLVRLSGIDLLRIIAMLFICLFHAMQTASGMVDYSSYGLATRTATYIWMQLGAIGNMLFVACSAFFLVDSSRSRLDKAIHILLDSVFVSVIIYLSTLFKGYPLSTRDVLSQFIPDVFGNNWFIRCYVVFYLLSPVVIYGLKHVGRRTHLGILIGAYLTYGICTWLGFSLFGSELLCFFFLLTLIAFAKWHLPTLVQSKKVNLILCLGGFALSFGIYFLARFLSNYFEPLRGRFAVGVWYQPFTSLAILGTVNLFGTMKFHNRFISYLGTATLFVYLIHENIILRQYVRVEFYQYVFGQFGEQTFLLWTFLCGIGVFVGAFIAAIIYKESIHRFSGFLSKKIGWVFNRLLDWVNGKLPSKE